MSNRSGLQKIQNDLAENNAAIKKFFAQEREFNNIRAKLIFEILKEEKILSKSEWDVVRDGSVFIAHRPFDMFTELKDLVNLEDDGGVYYQNLELSVNDNEVELVVGSFAEIPSFIKEHNLTINGKNFLTQRDILKSQIEPLEEIIILLGL